MRLRPASEPNGSANFCSSQFLKRRAVARQLATIAEGVPKGRAIRRIEEVNR
jgi:hypothetical protein